MQAIVCTAVLYRDCGQLDISNPVAIQQIDPLGSMKNVGELWGVSLFKGSTILVGVPIVELAVLANLNVVTLGTPLLRFFHVDMENFSLNFSLGLKG